MYRPKNWEKYHKFPSESEKTHNKSYEAGADATIEALRAEGREWDGDWPAILDWLGDVMTGRKGTMVFIPGEEE